MDTVVLDEKLAWEKPCGGGLTYKAYSRYPFLLENNVPKKIIHETCLAAHPAGAVHMDLEQSAADLFADGSESHAAGSRRTSGRATGEDARAGHGARRPRMASQDAARRRSTRIFASWPRRAQFAAQRGNRVDRRRHHVRSRLLCASAQDHIDIQFLPNLEGYIWVFPRCGHLSVGICGKGEPAQALRARLEQYMNEEGHLLQRRVLLRPHASVARTFRLEK
jgi:hypothetical protein